MLLSLSPESAWEVLNTTVAGKKYSAPGPLGEPNAMKLGQTCPSLTQLISAGSVLIRLKPAAFGAFLLPAVPLKDTSSLLSPSEESFPEPFVLLPSP